MALMIGPYRVSTLETGEFALDGGAMFGVIPKTLWSREHPADELNRIELALRTLLLVGDDRVILVDTGIGEKFAAKYAAMYGISFEKFSLKKALAAHGLGPDDVTDVILTHLHFDHAGGATRLENGEPVPTFAKATYWVQTRNWEWANAPSEKDRASYLPENFLPLQASGQLQLLEGEGEILPGISAWLSDGHTIGQQLIKISDGQTTLIYCADIIPTASHLKLPYIMGYDLQPLLTLEEKRKVLQQAIAENWIVVFEHDPQLPACRVRQGAKGPEVAEKIFL